MFKKLDSWPINIIHVYINGKKIKANNGESVAATLLENNISFFKKHEISNEKRSAYCMMGVCYDCLVEIDGTPNMQSCMIKTVSGMNIKTQNDKQNK